MALSDVRMCIKTIEIPFDSTVTEICPQAPLTAKAPFFIWSHGNSLAATVTVCHWKQKLKQIGTYFRNLKIRQGLCSVPSSGYATSYQLLHLCRPKLKHRPVF